MAATQKTIQRQEAQAGGVIERLLPGNLRGRFLAVLFGVLLPSLTLFGVLHHDSVKRSLLYEVDQTLRNRAREIEQVMANSGIRGEEDFSKFQEANSVLLLTSAPEVYVDILTFSGQTLWASQNLVAKPAAEELADYAVGQTYETFSQPDGLRLRRLVKVLSLEDGSKILLILAESLAHLDSALEGSVGRTVLLGLVVLTLTEVLGNSAFRGIFYPLRNLVDTAETIASTDDVTRRVPVYLDADPEIQRTAQAFNTLMERVEQLLQIAKQLLADTSHELRNPLTVLMTDLDLLREDITPEQRDEVVTEAQHTVRRLTRLVSDLLLLSRTEAHSETLELEEVDVSQFVEKVASRFSRAHAEEGTILFHQEGEDERPSAQLNRERTEQILTNLFENGIRYSDAHEVRVTVLTEGEKVVISVRDEGCGIALDEQEKIFYRFYRVDRSRDRHSGGTGLGLAVARALARLQGGDIKLVSALGEGADFRVEFPIIESQNLEDDRP